MARRAGRASGGSAEARRILLEHLEAVRTRAGIDVEVQGRERLPPDTGFVVAYNQTSLADDLGNLEVLSGFTVHCVLAAEYGYIPFFRGAAERAGLLLLQRGNRAAADVVLERLRSAAAAGHGVSMAAEGRLSPDGEVGRFKRGAFLVAIRAGVPVVPMAVQGGREILAPGSLRCRGGTLRYRIGDAIEGSGASEGDAVELAEHTREAVAALYDEARGEC